MWRNDGKCGYYYTLPNGTAAQCDPDGENPCCSNINRYWNGECGNTTGHCSCWDCKDYKFAKWWRESGGTQMWRNDGKCGSDYPLPNGTAAQCDPDGGNPCCSDRFDRECGNTTEHCSCQDCTDYKFAEWWRESGGTQMWRNDGKCGSYYPLPNGTAAQCDPDGENPCCSDGWNGECGNTTEHCSCRYCTDYKFVKLWRESGGKQMWRNDEKCGSYYPLPNGTAAQCDPDGENPCCSNRWDGECGNTARHCSCRHCTDYKFEKFAKWWRESGGTQMWRNDGKCGSGYPLPNGTAAQCDPDEENPCCSSSWDGRCGNTAEHCSCNFCINYKNLYREWEESKGTKKWRYDGKCGKYHPLPDGSPSQCDPGGKFPCCDDREWGKCSGTREDCTCQNCTDYRKIKWRDDERCGSDYPLPDGSPAQCNPGGGKPCCNQDGKCSGLPADCFCKECTDHRLKIKWTKYRMCDLWKNGSLDLDVIFKCDNGMKCVAYDDVCNRVDDCGDKSDEIYCTNHMICKSTLNADNPKYVSKSATCDGYPDCFDWSDECNDSCRKEILEGWALKITGCFMGILAIFLNCVSMLHGVTSIIHDCPTEKMMITKVLMSLIGFGDFIIGIYLIVLSIYDSLVYRSSYCVNQAEWLTGTPCMILGVISTVGSQLSLFSMTTLSCIIMYGVVFNEMRFPSEVTRRSVLKATALALTLLAVSLFIAVTPLIPALEDYFVQGVYYDSDIDDLLGFLDKPRLNSFLANISFPRSWSWSDLRKNMFELYGDLPSYPVHFYGNDGVCLFKYFFRRDNEYTYENILEKENSELESYLGDEIINTRNVTVGTMLAVNFACFVVITVCYIAIICKTTMSTQESGQSDNPDRLTENKALQNRIVLIIVTDFLCWVPFIIVSGMHNLKYIDASTWYTPFAMTLLPINSVINPVIYDKILLEFFKKKFGEAGKFIVFHGRNISTWIKSTRLFHDTTRQIMLVRENITVRSGNITVRSALNRLCRRCDDIENAVAPENAIEMEIINQ